MPLSQLEFDRHNTASTLIVAEAGNIEVLITLPENITEMTPTVIISHPHPLYGGSMTNKVVHILAKSFTELNVIVVKYNFRGVGQSEGEYDEGLGEAEDLQLLAKTIRQWRPKAPIWLAGFSFGAYVTTRAQSDIKAEKIVLVAPPVNMYPFQDLADIDIPWIVIQGGEDEVIDANAIKSWVKSRPHAPEFIWMQDAGHFFHGKLNDIKAAILQVWS